MFNFKCLTWTILKTEVIAGEGLILTAGGIDAHVHFICSQLADEAIASGLTTLLGGKSNKPELLFIH